MHRFGLCGRRPVIYGLWSMCRPRDGRRRGEDGRLRWPQSRDFSGKSRFASPGARHRPTRVPDFEVVPRPTHSGASTGSMATRSLVRVGSCSGPQDADFSILPRSALELQIVPFLVFASSDALYAFLEHVWRRHYGRNFPVLLFTPQNLESQKAWS